MYNMNYIKEFLKKQKKKYEFKTNDYRFIRMQLCMQKKLI